MEIFFSSNPSGDRGDAGVWCLGLVRENAPTEASHIQVHVFGGVNEHPLHTSTGEAIVGPNSFGYNLVIPRYASPCRMASLIIDRFVMHPSLARSFDGLLCVR